MLDVLRSHKDPWDIIIIGGGATGLGTAIDAASRGYKTLLLEQHDFGKGTSSRSTKLVHGGVRYLAQGNISLVYEGLRERGLMIHNAPHLVRNQKFIIPVYSLWDRLIYTLGLKLYDLMAGRLRLGPSRWISKETTIQALPSLNKNGLQGGILYHDGQFDDSRMLISMARTCTDNGGIVMNYMKVKNVIKENGGITGLEIHDQEEHEEYNIRAKSIINATGVFADEIIQLDEPGRKQSIKPSQGIHIILDKQFLTSDYALMVPRTSDGRVMFAVPWYNRVVVGTTDTPVDQISLEPSALDEEISFLLETTGQYLDKKPTRQDILSIFTGLRPLIAPEGQKKSTKDISRKHKINVSPSGLITVVGGKWTSYRKMAEDAVNKAINTRNLPERNCKTTGLKISGYDIQSYTVDDPFHSYGSDWTKVENIENECEDYAGFLSEELKIKKCQIIWAIREEMARTVEDVLARRTRALFLDARESVRIAPETARLMAKEFRYGEEWISEQLKQYMELAKGYLLN
jgi:glycerol-3-phosphate dehydrogenase